MNILGLTGGGSGFDGGAVAAFSVAYIVIALSMFVLGIVWSLFYLRGNDRKDTFLGKLFTFDYYVIEKIMQVVYIFGFVGIIGVCLVLIVVNFLSGNYQQLFTGIVASVFLFVVWQIGWRLLCEWIFLKIRQATDIRVLRDMVAEVPAIKATGIEFDRRPGFVDSLPEKFQKKIDKTADRVVESADDISTKAQTRINERAVGEAWDCECGRKRNRGAFCPVCGRGRGSSD